MEKIRILSRLLCICAAAGFVSNAVADDTLYQPGAGNPDPYMCDVDFLKSSSEATFVAMYDPAQWTVTYDADGGSSTPADQTCTYDAALNNASPCVAAGAITKTGHTFGGWDVSCALTGGSCADFSTSNVTASGSLNNVTSSDGAVVTLTAHWNACTACNSSNPNSVTCNMSVVSNQCNYVTTCNAGYGNIQNNAAYNAVCSPNTYTITYNGLEDGDNNANNPATYNIETNTFTIANPTRTGYGFAGWTVSTEPTVWGNNSVHAGGAVTVGKGTYGNIVLTANWQANGVTLNWIDENDNVITPNPATPTCEYGKAFSLPQAPAVTGYVFAGWDLVGD